MTDGQAERTHTLVTDAAEVLRARAESLAQLAEEERVEDVMGLLLFALGEEWYSVRIEEVREILQDYEVTDVPCLPSHILGVANIRGEIVSVTDLARQMQLRTEPVSAEQPPAIVVTNGECVTALVVDSIGDIVDVPNDSIEPPLSTIGKSQAEFVAGSVYVDGSLIGVMNLDHVLTPIGAGEH